MKKIKRSIVSIALAVLAALWTGKNLLVPAQNHMSKNWYALLVGTGLVAVAVIVKNIATALIIRGNMMHERRTSFPKDISEIKAMGVTTPLDFAYMMVNYLNDIRPPLLGACTIKRYNEVETIYDPQIIREGDSLYREMFDSMPSGGRHTDWEAMAKAELEEKLGEPLKHMTMTKLSENVSPGVKQYFDAA